MRAKQPLQQLQPHIAHIQRQHINDSGQRLGVVRLAAQNFLVQRTHFGVGVQSQHELGTLQQVSRRLIAFAVQLRQRDFAARQTGVVLLPGGGVFHAPLLVKSLGPFAELARVQQTQRATLRPLLGQLRALPRQRIHAVAQHGVGVFQARDQAQTGLERLPRKRRLDGLGQPVLHGAERPGGRSLLAG